MWREIVDAMKSILRQEHYRRRPKRPLPRRTRPWLEALEDRLVPANTLLWVNGDGNGSWFDSNNWMNTVTAKPATPAAGDNLIFDRNRSPVRE